MVLSESTKRLETRTTKFLSNVELKESDIQYFDEYVLTIFDQKYISLSVEKIED